MSFITPAAAAVMADLESAFMLPGIKFGIYNRRKIAGTMTWSQHSWPNALDIFFTNAGDTSAAHQAQLDTVHAYLISQGYPIRTLIWRAPSHFGHIHVDFWPRGYSTPSLVRGGEDNRYVTADGTILTQAELVGEEDDVIGPGSTGPTVVKIQEQLMAQGYDLPQYGADGDYGDETKGAVQDFQTDNQLEDTGSIDAVTAAILFPGPRGPRGRPGKDGAVPDLTGYTLQPPDVV
jgi:hypothetical protein